MKYVDYMIEDFLEDGKFVEWVNAPTAESNQFWTAFLRNNPSKVEVVVQAKAVLISLRRHVDSDFPDDKRVSKMLEKIRAGILGKEL
ncbi:hypothetical protein [Dyadobacter sp. BHUBP1]|uniref:hypothetical protein n=1 Tax=Dyadobacter sp. BHUBP1 TaxID=3424178 RepID=UPI003D32CFE3